MPAATTAEQCQSHWRAINQDESPNRASDDQVPQDTHSNGNLTRTQEAVFACPEEGCTRTFLRHSSLKRHLLLMVQTRKSSRTQDLNGQSYSGLCREDQRLEQRLMQTAYLNTPLVPVKIYHWVGH